MSEAEFLMSKAGGATERGFGRPLNDFELMMIQMRDLAAAERQSGNHGNYDSLNSQLAVRQKIAASFEELNNRVAGAPVAPVRRAAPLPPSPAPRPAIVP